MPRDICNMEITINKGHFIRYLSSEPIGSRLKNVNILIDDKWCEIANGTSRPREREKIIKTTSSQITIISY